MSIDAITKFNPERWNETMIRGLKDYAEREFQNAMSDSDGAAGLLVWEILMEYPGTLLDQRKMPLVKPLVHFEIDEIVSSPVGFGENIFAWHYDETDQTVTPQDAMSHVVNFDVGVWSSDSSGGTTARMIARQILTDMFSPLGMENLRAATNGGDGALEGLRFTGGRNTPDRVNDMVVYRTVGSELTLRVFSRRAIRTSVPRPTIEDITQDPGLTIVGGEPLS